MIIKQKEKKERKKDNRHIKVHIGTLRYYVHLFEIKLQTEVERVQKYSTQVKVPLHY